MYGICSPNITYICTLIVRYVLIAFFARLDDASAVRSGGFFAQAVNACQRQHASITERMIRVLS